MRGIPVVEYKDIESFIAFDEEQEAYNALQRRLMNLMPPVQPQDAATKAYVDAAIAASGGTGSGPLAMPFTVIIPSGGDDTPQIEAASVAGAVLYFKGGDYLIDTECNVYANGVHLRCSGTASTKFTIAPGITGFKFRSPRGSFSGASMTGGNLCVQVDRGNNSFDLYDLSIWNCVNAIQVNGDFLISPRIDCIQTIIRDIEVQNHTGAAIKIFHNGDTHLANIRTFGGLSVGSVGIHIDSGATAVYATNCNILAADKGLVIANTIGVNSDTGSLARPGQFIFTGCLFDTCKGYAADIQTTFQAKFHGCWFGGTQENEGLLIRSAAEVELDGCHFIANAKHGLRVQAGGINSTIHLKIIGGHFYTNGRLASNTNGRLASNTNGRLASNTYDGAHFEAGVGHVTMIGAQCYNDPGMNFTESQRYGIYFADGTGNGNIVIGNNCLNNMQAQGIYYGATGSERQVIGNLPLIANIGGTAASGDYITYTSPMNPASLPNGGMHVQAFGAVQGVSGVVKGDVCQASFDSINTAGWFLQAHAVGANNIAVTLKNETGGTVDLPAGTLKICVFK